MPYKPKNPFLFKLITSIGLVLLASVAIILVGLDTKSVATEVISSKEEVNKRIKQVNELAELREEAKAASAYLPILEGSLPEKDSLFSFPDKIRSLASQNGVNVNFSFGSEGPDSIGYNMLINGTYAEVVAFLRVIEDIIPYASISSIDVASEGTGSRYTIKIGGNLFFK